MTTASVLDIRQLSDAELADAWSAGHIDLAGLTDTEIGNLYCGADEATQAACEAEMGRRDAEAAAARDAETARAARSARARNAARARHAPWEAAAYANYEAAEIHCRGDANMLSEAGRRTGRAPWPMLWQGSREAADKLASDDLITFWDYTSPRPPSASEYAAVVAAERYDSERADMRDGLTPMPAPVAAAWESVPGGQVLETVARVNGTARPAWFAADRTGAVTMHPDRARAVASLAPAPRAPRPLPDRADQPAMIPGPAVPAPRPTVAPMSQGAIARYTAALAAFGRQADRTARAMSAARDRDRR
jgi:hypothetical protein